MVSATPNAAGAAFLAARDHLLGSRGDLAAARAFPRPRPEEFNWALDFFDPQARGNDAIGLRVVDIDADGTTAGETALSFAQLAERSDRVAGWLRSLGVRRGDRILMVLGNRVELWDTMLAAIKLGAVLIPATTLLSAADLADRLERGAVRHVIAEASLVERFGDTARESTRIAVGGTAPEGWQDFATAYRHPSDFTPEGETRSADPMLLYFTSGTTQQPKLVQHTHASAPIGHLSTMYWIGVRPGDVHLNISSSGWAKHAWSNFFAPWNAGAEVLVVNQPRFAARPLLDAMERYAVTSFCAPPTVWRMLIQEDLTQWKPPLRELVGAGEPLNPEIIAQVRRAWGVTLRDGYGQTETTAVAANPPGLPVKEGFMGLPLPGYEVALIDPVTGQEAPEGEVCLPLTSEPLGLMAGYQDTRRQAEATAGGYYHTGDVATRDSDGYLSFVGRVDDVFKASDYRISPFELESVLLEHPAVAEAAVVPSPDPVRLAVPKAYVLLAAGHSPSAETARAILEWSREQLAPYKRIRRLEFAELPKTVSGKIRRVELRSREHDLHGGPEAPARAENEYWEEDF